MLKLQLIHIVICFVIFDKKDRGKTYNLFSLICTDIRHNAPFLINLAFIKLEEALYRIIVKG